jgi:hypothetical protein
VRIALKPVAASTTTVPVAGLKPSGANFLDMLVQISGIAVEALAARDSGTQGQADGGSTDNHGSQDAETQTPSAQVQASDTAQTPSTPVTVAPPNPSTVPQSTTSVSTQVQSPVDAVQPAPTSISGRLVLPANYAAPASVSQIQPAVRRLDRPSASRAQSKPAQTGTDQSAISLQTVCVQTVPTQPMIVQPLIVQQTSSQNSQSDAQQTGSQNSQSDSSTNQLFDLACAQIPTIAANYQIQQQGNAAQPIPALASQPTAFQTATSQPVTTQPQFTLSAMTNGQQASVVGGDSSVQQEPVAQNLEGATADSALLFAAKPSAGPDVSESFRNEQPASIASSAQSREIASVALAATNQIVEQQGTAAQPEDTVTTGRTVLQPATNRPQSPNSSTPQLTSQSSAQLPTRLVTLRNLAASGPAKAAEAATDQFLTAAFTWPSNPVQTNTVVRGIVSSQTADGNAAESVVQPKASVIFTPDVSAPAGSAGATNDSAATPAANVAAANPVKVNAQQPDTTSASHAAQGAPQSVQHPQPDPVQASAITTGPVGSTATQTIAAPLHSVPSDPAPTHASAATSSTSQHTQESRDLSDIPDSIAAAGAPAVNTAKLIQSMSESEMRLGMHSTEFGDISIRTSVSQEQVQAQINVDHNELGSAIAAHIPSLEAKLGTDFGIHASVEVNQLGSSFYGGHGQSSQQGQQTFARSVSATEITQADDTESFAFSAALPATSNGRLDIRA